MISIFLRKKKETLQHVSWNHMYIIQMDKFLMFILKLKSRLCCRTGKLLTKGVLELFQKHNASSFTKTNLKNRITKWKFKHPPTNQQVLLGLW